MTRKHSLHGPKFTPEQERWRKDAYNRARYGSDSQSPLFWILENLHANDMHTYYCLAEKKIRISEPAADYINALLEEWKRNQECDEQSTDLELLPASLFFDLATIAVRRRDAAFFEEVARILREKIVPRQEDMAGRHVVVAYEEVKQPGSEPTKKEVRERALRKLGHAPRDLEKGENNRPTLDREHAYGARSTGGTRKTAASRLD